MVGAGAGGSAGLAATMGLGGAAGAGGARAGDGSSSHEGVLDLIGAGVLTNWGLGGAWAGAARMLASSFRAGV